MEVPAFTLHDVKYACDVATFARAERLFQDEKVGVIQEIGLGRNYGYRAKVKGTRVYDVWVSGRHIDEGDCTCPMGEREMLCKHMLALGLAVLTKTVDVTEVRSVATLTEAKQFVGIGMKKLRAYDGPSRTWFSYQRKLASGAGTILEAVRGLPASQKNAEYLWKLVLRLSEELATGGIDDSNGTVGDCIESIVSQLAGYAHEIPALTLSIRQYCKADTGFGFEDSLRQQLQK